MDRELIDFAKNIVKLKRVARKGWISQVGVDEPESVADHSFGCAALTVLSIQWAYIRLLLKSVS